MDALRRSRLEEALKMRTRTESRAQIDGIEAELLKRWTQASLQILRQMLSSRLHHDPTHAPPFGLKSAVDELFTIPEAALRIADCERVGHNTAVSY